MKPAKVKKEVLISPPAGHFKKYNKIPINPLILLIHLIIYSKTCTRVEELNHIFTQMKLKMCLIEILLYY